MILKLSKEEGRTRLVLREIHPNSTNQSIFDTLTQFSSDFTRRRVPTVQIYYKQHWQDLSGDDLLRSTGEVICKSHGFANIFFIGKFETNNSKDHILLNCTGSESSTSECTIQEYSLNTSSNYLPILVCSYEEGYISLYNNQSHSRNKGEVQYSTNSSSLAFVCTDNWSAIESSVVCSQLGYPTLLNYNLVLANLSDQSQYNYYQQIDTLHMIEANFECSGYESSLRDCGITRVTTNSTVCQRNIVNITCEPDQLIHNETFDCYNYIEFLAPSLNYKFKNEYSSNCFSLYNVLSLTNDIKSTSTGKYFIQSISFERTISMHSNFIKLSSTTDIQKRSIDNSEDLCYVIYFDSKGAPLSVAGITNSTTLTYSTLYHVTDYPDAIQLTGNITNLQEPINTTSMSLVCDKAGTSISNAYLLSSHSEPSITTVDSPSFIGNFESLQGLETAYKSVITPTTPPITTTDITSTSRPIPNHDALMFTGIATGVIVFVSIIVSTFICLLHILRRHYKKEIVTLQIQSKAVVSSVYPAENCANDHFLNLSQSTNNYVQQNVYYYKLKLKSNTCAQFVESTRSIRHTMLTVSIVPKFGVKMPEVNYVGVNSKRNFDTTDQWHLERDKLVYLRELGLGYYGKVQLMEAKNMYGYDKLPVAVKTLSTQDKQQTEQFMREVKLMMSLQNEYVVSLLGFCPPTKDATPLMVLEYMEFGDLKSLIQSYLDTPATRERELNILHLVSMAHNIASALVYLAEHYYVHRDIAARNCLVGKGLICKLSDFGLTLMTDGQSSNALPRINTTVPVKWTAPETFLSGVFSFSSDVWSYGVFLWEIFSYGAEPLEDLTKDELISAIKSGTLALPHIPNVPGFCNDLIQMCCFFDHLQRPYIQDVKGIIEGVLFQNESNDSNSVHSCTDDEKTLVESTII
ncbi:NT-3 growth factor receptor [Oopsacas minuta]|uniref:NT-3 growth factor receptor n=1 Tax=Oopsacas minuta TaxID=111878 RepID=A0AAV7K2S7_9METZ|nr:NT-3 growth factor receptor [Oopsacas minuta]